MSINDTHPSTLTSLLVATERDVAENGSPDGVPSFTSGADGQPASVAVEIQSTEGGFLLPRMTTVQKDALNPTPGLTVFDTDEHALSTFGNGIWTLPTAGDVAGPGGATVIDNIATWADVDGLEIKDSGVGIAQVPIVLSSLSTVNVNAIENFALLKLDDVTHSGIGGIFVDSTEVIKFIRAGSQVCTLFTDFFPDDSSSPSALVELQSTTGALLLSRMNTAQMNALFAVPGMLLYNTELGSGNGSLVFRNNASAWVEIGSGGGGNLTLTGAVTGGPGSGTINTLLSETVECQANVGVVLVQKFNFANPGVSIFNVNSVDPSSSTTLSLSSGGDPFTEALLLSFYAQDFLSVLDFSNTDFYVKDNGGIDRLVIQNSSTVAPPVVGAITIDASGNIFLEPSITKTITNLRTPTAASDAATKGYVDNNSVSSVSGTVNGTVLAGDIVTKLNTLVKCEDIVDPFTQTFQFNPSGTAIFQIDSQDTSTPTILGLTSGGFPVGLQAFYFSYEQTPAISSINFGNTKFHIADNSGVVRLAIENSTTGTGGQITIDGSGNITLP